MVLKESNVHTTYIALTIQLALPIASKDPNVHTHIALPIQLALPIASKESNVHTYIALPIASKESNILKIYSFDNQFIHNVVCHTFEKSNKLNV